jgi:hypothetical protein
MMTEDSGRFEIRNLAAGRYVLRAMMIGYGATTREVVIRPGEVTNCTLVLADTDWWKSVSAVMAESIGVDVDVSPDDLPCRLMPVKPVYQVGDTIEFDVRLKNTSRDTVWLIVSHEATGFWRRYPVAGVTIASPEGPWRTFSGGILPRPERSSLADLIELAPGEEFDPLGGRWHPRVPSDAVFSSPGRHRVTFWYSVEEPVLRNWLEGVSPADWTPAELSYRTRRVPLIELSCTIEVEVLK